MKLVKRSLKRLPMVAGGGLSVAAHGLRIRVRWHPWSSRLSDDEHSFPLNSGLAPARASVSSTGTSSAYPRVPRISGLFQQASSGGLLESNYRRRGTLQQTHSCICTQPQGVWPEGNVVNRLREGNDETQMSWSCLRFILKPTSMSASSVFLRSFLFFFFPSGLPWVDPHVPIAKL